MTESDYQLLVKACKAMMYKHNIQLPFGQDEYDLAAMVYIKIPNWNPVPDYGIMCNAAYQLLIDKVSRSKYSCYKYVDIEPMSIKDDSSEYDSSLDDLYDEALKALYNSGRSGMHYARGLGSTNAPQVAQDIIDFSKSISTRRRRESSIKFKSPNGDIVTLSAMKKRRDKEGKHYCISRLLRDGYERI